MCGKQQALERRSTAPTIQAGGGHQERPSATYSRLVDEDGNGAPKDEQQLPQDESGGWLAEWMGAILTTAVTVVLNITYAGVIMG